MARFFIGDVHGCAQTLEALLQRIGPARGDTLIFLGDYIDRGPNSKGVIDLVMDLQDTGPVKVVALAGNHEDMMVKAFERRSLHSMSHWLRNGGAETLASFGFKTDRVPDELHEPYKSWLAELPIIYVEGDLIAVHAGLNLSAEDPLREEPETMLWIRDWFDAALMAQRLPEKRVIHGHSPLERWAIEKAHSDNLAALNLDSGCVYPQRSPSMGYLCAYEADSDHLHFMRNLDMP